MDTFKSIIGEYQPIQSLVSGSVEEGTAVYQYSVDWSYVAVCAVFVILVYSIMRLIGIILGGNNK